MVFIPTSLILIFCIINTMLNIFRWKIIVLYVISISRYFHIIQLNYNWKGHWNTRINNIYYGTDTWESRTPNRHVLRIIYHPSITHVIKHFSKDKKTNIFVRKTWEIGNTFFPKGKLYWYIKNQVIFTCYIEFSSEQNLSFVDFDNNMETKAQIWYYVSDLHNM